MFILQMLENSADKMKDQADDKVAGIEEKLPMIKQDNKATKQKIKSMDYPDLQPLQDLVEGRQKYFSSFFYKDLLGTVCWLNENALETTIVLILVCYNCIATAAA